MADLKLKGLLNLLGNLKLNPQGGKVLIGDAGLEALVENAAGQAAPPVLIPPPPASPTDPGTGVKVPCSRPRYFVLLTSTSNGPLLLITSRRISCLFLFTFTPGLIEPLSLVSGTMAGG